MKKWERGLLALAGTVAGMTVFVQPAWANHDDHWHGRIEHFHENDWNRWRGGQWHHEYHDGRWGWWWLVGPTWYYYPQPVYPYPNPYEPPVAVIVQPTPPPQSAPLPPAPVPQNWYYCESARGYYPYVPACPSGWRAVPATPGTAPAMPGGAAPSPY